MTNEQYRKARGTAAPFKTTEEQARKAWFELNRDAILKRRLTETKFGKRRKFMEPIEEFSQEGGSP